MGKILVVVTIFGLHQWYGGDLRHQWITSGSVGRVSVLKASTNSFGGELPLSFVG